MASPLNTEIEVANLALEHLGKPSVTSFTQGTAEARKLKLQYPMARGIALEFNPWTFARRITAAAQISENELSNRWEYAYDVPDDMIKFYGGIPDGAVWDRATQFVPTYLANGKIYSNEPELFLCHTVLVDRVAHWSAQFTDAVALLLASRIAPQFTRRRQDVEALYVQYADAIRAAAEFDAAQEHAMYTADVDGYIDARGAGAARGDAQPDGSSIWD